MCVRKTNLGGAGGFSLAILTAMASGADWIWIMDDDAHPEDPGCLLGTCWTPPRNTTGRVLPLVVAPGHPDTLSFHFRMDGQLTHERPGGKAGFLPDVGHFFNGALIRADVFFRVGLPDLRLFIRGDETDFMIRLRRAGVRFGTVTSVALTHPAAWAEVQEVLGGDRLHVLVPENAVQAFYFYRNRGHLTWKYKRLRSFAADAVGYPVHFIKTRDPRGFAAWLRAYASGMRGRFGPPSDYGF